MNEFLILGATFVGVLILSTLVVTRLAHRGEVQSRLADVARGDVRQFFTDEDIGAYDRKQATLIRNYFNVVRKDTNPESLANRLIRAGYFSPSAPRNYQILRAAIAFAVFVGGFALVDYLFPNVSRLAAMLLSAMVAMFVFFLANIVLERMGVARERAYRRIFPDFMDMLIVCVDAGLSIEAAADRVAREFMVTRPDFGVHLSIMMLEVRGGRRLRDALTNLADRLHVDEAKSLATLFRQSEELGSSVTKSLRVYSAEMRQKRLLRAEEKANSLPIKMLFPLATFLFPMSILIVLVPIVIKVGAMLIGLSPGGG